MEGPRWNDATIFRKRLSIGSLEGTRQQEFVGKSIKEEKNEY
jgi:hypothetical protein